MLALSIKIHEKRDSDDLLPFKWITENSRKHWLLNKHCYDLLLPKFWPNPPLLTDESKFYWHVYTSSEKYDKNYQRNLCYSLNSTLSRRLLKKVGSLKYILLSESLINLDRFNDVLGRKKFIHNTAKFIRNESLLEIVFFEGLRLTKAEGHEILCALASSEKSLRFLFLWHFFKLNEYSQSKKIELFPDHKAKKHSNFCFHHHWLSAIENLQHIETLAINYSYISSSTGDLLIHVARQLGRNWRWLQLLCLEEEIPGTKNSRGEYNAVTIPDLAWSVVRKFSPKIRVQIVLLGIPEYDQHKKFITESIPMHTVVLSTNRELLFHKPCLLDCTFKTMYLWYHRHLEQLYINLWNHREMFDHHLRRIFPCLPNLKVFEFVGGMRDPVTICTMCCQIKIGTCAVKNVMMQLQIQDCKKNGNTLARINRFLECFDDDFDKLGVEFKVYCYPA